MATVKPPGEQVPTQSPISINLHELPAGLHFLVSTDVEKPNPEVRKFIRSHVMLGKNRGKTRIPRKRKEAERQEPPIPSLETSPANAVNHNRVPVGPSAPSVTTPYPVLPVTVPRKFGSDLSSIHCADVVEPGKLEVVLQCAFAPPSNSSPANGLFNFESVSSIAKKVLFPLEACLLFQAPVEGWVAPISLDPAYLHAVIVMSQCFFNTMLPNKLPPINQRTLNHVLKALKFLRERLARNDDQESLSNSTAAAVVNLAGYALLTGDSDTARHHMKGLHKIVGLRGGVAAFADNSKLLVEILRCDISITLQNGSSPVFFSSPSSNGPFLPFPDLTSLFNLHKPVATGSRYDSATSLDGIDDELARIWKAMSEFCTVINSAAESRQRISTDVLLDTIASIMYRLLNMRFEDGCTDEVIRLGLLAFSCSVFLPRNYPGMSHPYFTPAFRACLTSTASHQVSPQLLLWLLMVGSVSVFGATDDEWTKNLLFINISLCNIGSWSEMQDLLRSFMWVGMVHDKPGRRVFDSVIF